MKKNPFSWLTFAITGIGIGIPVALICMTLIDGFNGIIAEMLTWTVASALLGIISGLVFGKADLNLPIATAIHCVCCLAVALAASAICGYADNFLSLLVAIVPIFVVVYVLIYSFVFLTMKRQEKKINRTLNKE